jgi:glycerate 2-kinase
MAAAAARHLGPNIRAGLAIASEPATAPAGFELMVGGHPLPTTASEQAGRKALALTDALAPDETLLVLLSGGASALMAAPAGGITLNDKRETTRQLLHAGADIYALNTVRKHLSAIKGGWLAARAHGACHALAISDVVGDDLSVIASGPTVADASRFEDALAVLQRFGGEGAYPAAVVARLHAGVAGAAAETPKPGDPRLASTRTSVIGSRLDAMEGAATEAGSLGYHVLRLDDAVVGEARTTAVSHLRAAIARAAGVGRPACIVSSGETTVRVTGGGKGGRNQEFALAAAAWLAGTGLGDDCFRDPSPPFGGDLFQDPSPRLVDQRGTGFRTAVDDGHGNASQHPIVLASVGTDGIDGPTDAAGAIADSTTIERAHAAGLAPARALSDNNAYAFFDALGDLIHTGPTGTNVGDLQVILLA